MAEVSDFLDQLRKQVSEVEVIPTFQEQQKGHLLIDIRERDETETESPLAALRIPKGVLEMEIGRHVEKDAQPIYLICASGRRSLVAGYCLQQMGFSNVHSVKGGVKAWKDNGLPIETPQRLKAKDYERYKRHLLIPEVGEEGQLKLLNSKVLIVGAGGIGSPVAWYLAAAGVGTIGIMDDDVVDRTNLQRQILHTEESVGKEKVVSAKERLEALNPSITIRPINERLTEENVEDLIKDYDLVLDGTDNYTTRYLINDACVKFEIPNVHGSVFRFEGQVSTFWPAGKDEGPCYRCIYPSPPPAELAPSCAEAGVLGVLPGLVGVMCATEAIKVLLGIGELLTGKLLRIDALTWDIDIFEIDAQDDCSYCKCNDANHYPAYHTYDEYCTVPV